MHFDALHVLILLIAAYRGTRFVVEDQFPLIRWIRTKTWGRLREGNFLKELLSCAWCASMWLSAAMLVVAHYWPQVWWVYLVLAMSAAAGLLGTIEEKIRG